MSSFDLLATDDVLQNLTIDSRRYEQVFGISRTSRQKDPHWEKKRVLIWNMWGVAHGQMGDPTGRARRLRPLQGRRKAINDGR
jgi:hypothetical protein